MSLFVDAALSAMAVEFPRGRYRGRTVGELALQGGEEEARYLIYTARQGSQPLRDAAIVVIDAFGLGVPDVQLGGVLGAYAAFAARAQAEAA